MPIFRSLCCTALALIALAPFAARANDSYIDTTFNPSGVDPGWRRAYDAVAPADNQFSVAAARAPDGGYVLAGVRDVGSAGSLIFLAKFRPNGNYDLSFGGTAATGNAGPGRVLKDANFTGVADMTIDAQGRIVVVGPTPGSLGQSDFGIVRFNANGADDTSFAGDGSTYVGFDLDGAHGRTSDVPYSVTTAPDGAVYVAGRVQDVTIGAIPTKRVGVAKIMPDGTNTNTGYGTLPYGRQVFCDVRCENVAGVARIVYDAPRNRLVIGGDYFRNDNGVDWYIITQNFGASPTWQTETYTIDLGGTSGVQRAFMKRLAVQADGKPVAIGSAYNANKDPVPVVLRRQANSTAEDTSFGNVGGRGLLLGTVGSIYYDLAFDSSGRIALAGTYFNNALMTRLLPANGAVDTSFNGDNVPTVYVATTSGGPAAHSTLFTHVFLDGGHLVVAGIAPDSSTTDTDYDLIIMRMQADSIFANGFQ